jgi:ATP-binding cassette subfamily G (WHITE) protein 2 (PDR)
VGQTLEHAAALRTPSNRPMGVSRPEFSGFITKVVMAVLGLSHTYNTKVGNDFVRGVSGGERKRVSVAEMLLAGAPFAAWDNSTRGLDSATALKFVKVRTKHMRFDHGAFSLAGCRNTQPNIHWTKLTSFRHSESDPT